MPQKGRPRHRAAFAAAIGLALAAAAPLLLHLLRSAPGSGPDAPREAPSLAAPDAPTALSKPAWERIDDARRDGWDTEVFASMAGRQLGLIAGLIERPSRVAASDVGGLGEPDFSCGDLRPRRLAPSYDDGILRVERGRGTEPEGGAGSGPRRGPEGLAAALDELAEPFRGASGPRFGVKVFRVEAWAGGSILTRLHLSLSGRSREGFLEEHAGAWAAWTRPAGGEVPRLRSLGCASFERVLRRTPRPFLADATESVLGRNASYRDQFLHGLNHWLERIQDNRFFSLLGTPGLAVGDVNGDGLDDLYVCQEGGLPNRLFLQDADGTATDVSAAAGVDWIDSSRSALLVDLDNDGGQDLVAAVLGNLVAAQGDGSASFAIRAVLPTSHDTMSLCAADCDLDGDLDLYLCAYKQDDLSRDSGVLSIGASADFVYHDANNGARNYLFRNDIAGGGAGGGEWRFTDVTVEAGLDLNNRRFSFAASWEDFDNDGDQDLYVANDFGRNNLYRNDTRRGAAPRFTDVAAGAGAEDSASGMSVAWGDFDRDGWMDLHVSNMFSAAGSRITYQPAFKPEAAADVRSRLQRFARGDTLLRNLGGRAFEDVSEAAAVTLGRWAWSSNFIDLENDGWEDLVVANGYVTTEDPGDL